MVFCMSWYFRVIFYLMLSLPVHQPHHHLLITMLRGLWCLCHVRINWEACGRKASGIKMGDDGGGSLISPDGVALTQIVGVSASVIFSSTIKSRRRFLLAPAHPGSRGKRAVKWLCGCVCVLSVPVQLIAWKDCPKMIYYVSRGTISTCSLTHASILQATVPTVTIWAAEYHCCCLTSVSYTAWSQALVDEHVGQVVVLPRPETAESFTSYLIPWQLIHAGVLCILC